MRGYQWATRLPSWNAISILSPPAIYRRIGSRIGGICLQGTEQRELRAGPIVERNGVCHAPPSHTPLPHSCNAADMCAQLTKKSNLDHWPWDPRVPDAYACATLILLLLFFSFSFSFEFHSSSSSKSVCFDEFEFELTRVRIRIKPAADTCMMINANIGYVYA
jgi:hypothetical protein